MLWTDKGEEIYNQNVVNVLKKYHVKLHSTENEEKGSHFKRFNSTIKHLTRKMFSLNNNTIYWDKIELIALLKSTITRHLSIKISPVQVSRK